MNNCVRAAILVSTIAWGLGATAQNAKQRPAISQGVTIDHLAAGRAFGAEKKWREAEAELRIYRNQHPDSPQAIALHAEALIQLSQPFDAALEVQSFLKEHPSALRVHELYAVLAAGPLKDTTLATSELEICVRLKPDDFQAWQSLGDLQMEKSKPDKAIEAYEHASRLRPRDPVVAASLAHAYAGQGEADKAVAQFAVALRMLHSFPASDKDAGIVHYLYGVFLAEQGRGQESVDALTVALKFNPNSADAYYWRARAYEKAKNLKMAESDALKALQLAPFEKEAPLFLITLYRKAGDMDNAQKFADISKKFADTEQSQASFGRALRDSLDKAESQLKSGRFADAIPLYESIISRLPTFYEAYFALGMCYAETGRPHDAEEAFRKYLSFESVSADGHAALGVLLLGQGRAREAMGELNQAIQIDPTATEPRKALAAEYLKEGNSRAAAEVLKPADKSTDVDLLLLLASALKQQGSTSSALAVLNRALVLEPANADAVGLKKSLQGNATTNSEK